MDIHDHPVSSPASHFVRNTVRKLRRLSKGGSPRQKLIVLVGWATLLFIVVRATQYLFSPTSKGPTNYFSCDSSRYRVSRSIPIPEAPDSKILSQTWDSLRTVFEANPPQPLTLTQKPFPNPHDFPPIEDIQKQTNLSKSDAHASRQSHAEVVRKIPDFPKNVFSGRGIVMLAGGRYSSFATTGLGMLREIGSKLPIEVWVKDHTEEKAGWCDEIKHEGMVCRRISDYMDLSQNKHGYQLKISSILFSSFEEILFLDADNVPIRNPDAIFESESFTNTGVVLWKDYWKHSGAPLLPYIVGISEDASEILRSDDTVESGQLVWDKKRHWKALCLATYYNYYGPQHYYTLISQGWAGWGDKDTFPVALQSLHEKFYLVPHKLKTMFVSGTGHGIGMLQADPTNQTGYEPMFLHSNVIKWGIRDFLCIGCPSASGDRVTQSALEKEDSSINSHLKEHRRIFKTEDMDDLGIDPEPSMWKSMEHTACRSVWRDDGLCARTREHMTKTFSYRFQTGRIASMLGFQETIYVPEPAFIVVALAAWRRYINTDVNGGVKVMEIKTGWRGHRSSSSARYSAYHAGFGKSFDLGNLKAIKGNDGRLRRGKRGLQDPRLPSLWPQSLFRWWEEGNIVRMVLLVLLVVAQPANAAFLNFENCLGPNVVNSNPLQLQFKPLFVYAAFNSTAASHNINVTVYGNVTGQATQEQLPTSPNDPAWTNPNDTLGKITDVSKSNDKLSTLTATFNVLDYTPYDAPATQFCNTTVHGVCPLAPAFTANASDPTQLPAFSVAHDLYSSYAFTTISATIKVLSGDAGAPLLACISTSITPGLGSTISNVLRYLPLVILILVAIATACAAVFSPWGSVDIFRWTSNYGRDADLLRLVTPGFGDCLQYIQFIVLAGSLSLNYPGFFQPVVSQVSWSALMFNESFVSHGSRRQSLVDGVYAVNGTYGLDRMSKLVGMTAEKDIWAGMVIWLLVILAAVVVLIQAVFFCRWFYRLMSNTQEEDLRAKNMPFTVGNAIRVIFNYFLLPVVALSMFQLVVASHSPATTVALATLLIVALVGFTGWLLWLVASTRPRSHLFDDLPTVLLYGPLYNTYSDNAATFALVPVMLTFLRGIAIGAVQPSGIAQLVLLAICEVILILTLNAFRPFSSPTSMNAFHTFFAVVRLLTILLSVAFIPSLKIGDAPRGWIGYVVLLMHAIVLVFGFFLNACQTLIEVIARLAGAGGEEGVGGGATRGGLVKVFGMRQLSRRNPRRRGQARQSIASNTAMLGADGDRKSVQLNGGRSRSMSGSSAILLNRQGFGDRRVSVGLDSNSAAGAGNNHAESGSAPYTPTSGGASAFSYLPGASQIGGQAVLSGGAMANLKTAEASDPYYRPPRARRLTVDAFSPGTRSGGSWTSADWANKRWSQHSPEQEGSPHPAEGPSMSGRATPLPAHLGKVKDQSDSNIDDPRLSKTDYATREVDFYYGVRGPALSNLPTRRLKTGPADPTGPVSSATGWVKSLFGGKIKDTGKGFEVVRSSRAPPTNRHTQSGAMVSAEDAPYSDEPGDVAPERSRGLALSDEGDAIGGGTRHLPDEEGPRSPFSEDDDGSLSEAEWDLPNRASQVSQFPPSLPSIETGGGIELPSRIVSKASKRPSRDNTGKSGRPPTVPRKSSRRDSRHGEPDFEALRLSTIAPSPPLTSHRSNRLYNPDQPPQHRLQPSEGTLQRLPFEPQLSPSTAKRHSASAESVNSSILPHPSDEDMNQMAGHTRHSSSVLGPLAPHIRMDRPSSMGYVQQHRASDNIHTASPDDPPQLLGSSAELVDDHTRRSASPDARCSQGT